MVQFWLGIGRQTTKMTGSKAKHIKIGGTKTALASTGANFGSSSSSLFIVNL